MNNYFDKLNEKHLPQEIKELEKYACEHHVPIIMKDSLLVILALMDLLKPKRILEIGTAIGYSSICMAYYTKGLIDTIERDDTMYEIACQNIARFKLNDYIKVHHDDALEIDINKLSEYDMIFIDAAKAQNIKFFEKFSPLLKPNGLIITDNLQFHGAIVDIDAQSKNVRKMVEKIDKYNHYLSELPNFHTIFINVGDGISITRRKQNEVDM